MNPLARPRSALSYPLDGHTEPSHSLPGDCDRLGARVDEDEAAAELRRHRPERPAAGEGIQAPIAPAARGLDDPPEDPLGFLRRVAGLLPPRRRDDGVPPDIG